MIRKILNTSYAPLLVIPVAVLYFFLLFAFAPTQEPVRWEDNVKNPDNHEFVVETAFNCGDIPLDSVTQEMFDIRYNKGYTPAQLHDMYMNDQCGCPDSLLYKK